jgi:hypothetical protein
VSPLFPIIDEVCKEVSWWFCQEPQQSGISWKTMLRWFRFALYIYLL